MESYDARHAVVGVPCACSSGPRRGPPPFPRYLFGFGVAFHQGEGGNGFIGTSGFNYALSGVDDTSGASYGAEWAFFFFQYAFAAAAATITSGAVAERCTLTGYLAYVMLIVGLLYPVVVHWCAPRRPLPREALPFYCAPASLTERTARDRVWDPNGFLSAFNPEPPGPFKKLPGMIDFAGSGVVHLTGGVCAFMGALTIRPRLGRFVGDESDRRRRPAHRPASTSPRSRNDPEHTTTITLNLSPTPTPTPTTCAHLAPHLAQRSLRASRPRCKCLALSSSGSAGTDSTPAPPSQSRPPAMRGTQPALLSPPHSPLPRRVCAWPRIPLGAGSRLREVT